MERTNRRMTGPRGDVRDISMMRGRAWRIGNDIDFDLMRLAACARGVWDPSVRCRSLRAFGSGPQCSIPGNIIVADANCGAVLANEQVAIALRDAGVELLLAPSFERASYRNSINVGLPALLFPFVAEIEPGDPLEIDLTVGDVRNLASGWAYCVQPLPREVRKMIHDGGLLPHIQKKLARHRLYAQPVHKYMLQ